MKLQIDPEKELKRLLREKEELLEKMDYVENAYYFYVNYCKVVRYSDSFSLETKVNPELVESLDLTNHGLCGDLVYCLFVSEKDDSHEFARNIHRNLKEFILRCIELHRDRLEAHFFEIKARIQFKASRIDMYSKELDSLRNNES